MLIIPIKDWVLLYGGAIIAIFFGFCASLTVQLFIRSQELQLRIKQIEFKENDELFKTEITQSFTATKKFLDRILWAFGIFLVLVGAYIVLGFIFGQSENPQVSNVTNIYENCSYPSTSTITNNYYNLTEIKYQNHEVSVQEMKYFFKKRSEPI